MICPIYYIDGDPHCFVNYAKIRRIAQEPWQKHQVIYNYLIEDDCLAASGGLFYKYTGLNAMPPEIYAQNIKQIETICKECSVTVSDAFEYLYNCDFMNNNILSYKRVTDARNCGVIQNAMEYSYFYDLR